METWAWAALALDRRIYISAEGVELRRRGGMHVDAVLEPKDRVAQHVLAVVHVGLDHVRVDEDVETIALADLGRLGGEAALAVVRAHSAAVGDDATARARDAVSAEVERLALVQLDG